MKTSIAEFHQKFWIISIQKLVFHLPHLYIQVTHNCDKEFCETFKLLGSSQYFLCCYDYSEQVVSNFSNQNQSEYYGGNISVSI